MVRRAIESAISQTYSDIEIVVVDNCSMDNTWGVVQTYARTDSRVRCYRNERNIGPVANWLRCSELSQGKYIKILFSDDWMESDAIEHLLQPFQEGLDIAFTYSSVYGHLVGEEPKIWYRRTTDGLISTLDFLWDFVIGDNVPVSPSAGLFRRSDVLSSLTLEIPNNLGMECNCYGIGNDALIFWRGCEKYSYFYHFTDPLIHFAESEVDEPGFSSSLNRSGRGYFVFLCYQIAFAYFLATSALPLRTKRVLHTAMFVQRLPIRPWLLIKMTSEFSRLFRNNYNWWHFQFFEPRILGLMKKRLIYMVGRVLDSARRTAWWTSP